MLRFGRPVLPIEPLRVTVSFIFAHWNTFAGMSSSTFVLICTALNTCFSVGCSLFHFWSVEVKPRSSLYVSGDISYVCTVKPLVAAEEVNTAYGSSESSISTSVVDAALSLKLKEPCTIALNLNGKLVG